MLQNEFNSCQISPSCIWNAEHMSSFIGKYAGPIFETNKISAELWLGTVERPSTSVLDTMMAHNNVKKYIKGVGFQWLGKNAVSGFHSSFPDLKIMQSYNESGNGKNEWSAAEYSFQLMKQYFNQGANTYIFYNAVLDESAKNAWGSRQNSLTTIDRRLKKLHFNPGYYLLKHFSYFVKPGAKKLLVNGSYNNVLAFLNSDNCIVIVAMNDTDNAKNINIRISDKELTLTMQAHSIHTLKTTEW